MYRHDSEEIVTTVLEVTTAELLLLRGLVVYGLAELADCEHAVILAADAARLDQIAAGLHIKIDEAMKSFGVSEDGDDD